MCHNRFVLAYFVIIFYGKMLNDFSGGDIELLHWPTSTETWASTDSNGRVVLSAFGTELTSPTVYVSFSTVFAANSCKRIGSSYSSTIIAITDPSALSSIWVDYNSGVQTAPFNLTDLDAPVPRSIYDRQPWCYAYSSSFFSSSQLFGCNNVTTGALTVGGGSAGCTPECPTTAPYKPIIVLPPGVLNSIDPAWASCAQDLRGQYDPPQLLTPAAAAAEPTASPLSWPSIAATPASGPQLGGPIPTASTHNEVQPSKASQPDPNGDPTARPGSMSVPQESVKASGKSADPPPPRSSNLADPAEQTTRDAPQDPSAGASPVPNTRRPYGSDPAAPGSQSEGSSSAQADPQADPQEDPGDRVQQAGTGTQPSAQPDDQAIASSIVGMLDPHGSPSVAGNGAALPQDPKGGVSDDGSGDTAGDIVDVLNAPPDAASDPQDPKAFQEGASPPSAALSGDVQLAVVSMGGKTITAYRGQPLFIDDTTLYPEGPAMTVGGQWMSLGSDGVVAGSRTIPFSPITTSLSGTAVVSIGGQTLTAYRGRPLSIGDSALYPGGSPVTIGGQRMSLGNDGLVVGSRTIAFSPMTTSSPETAVVPIGGQTFTATRGQPLFIGGSVLYPDGPAATIDGQRISLGDDGLVVGSRTIRFSPATTPFASSGIREAQFALAGTVYTAIQDPNDPRVEVIQGQDGVYRTITVGGAAATIGGQIVTALSDGVEVGDKFVSFTSQVPGTHGAVNIETVAVFEAGGAIHTAVLEAAPGDRQIVVVDSSITLSQGAAATLFDGERISFGSRGLVVNGTIEPWATIASSIDVDGSGDRPASNSANGLGTGQTQGSATQPTATGAVPASSATRPFTSSWHYAVLALLLFLTRV
ncbi:MAG: hypothetical protein M1821_007090 [Bathelium mastoideum]|nr:MAG: hypothetical protein M1821_007090 [Bathelium mastoideum]